MTQPDGVVITLRDVYDLVKALSGKLDALAAEQRAGGRTTEEHGVKLGDHENRIRSLERGRWPVASVTVLIALGSLVVAVVVALTRP